MTDTPDETKCPFSATHRYTWAGESERYACTLHALQVARIARAMSYPLQIIPLEIEQMIAADCSHAQYTGAEDAYTKTLAK